MEGREPCKPRVSATPRPQSNMCDPTIPGTLNKGSIEYLVSVGLYNLISSEAPEIYNEPLQMMGYAFIQSVSVSNDLSHSVSGVLTE